MIGLIRLGPLASLHSPGPKNQEKTISPASPHDHPDTPFVGFGLELQTKGCVETIWCFFSEPARVFF